MSDTTVTARDFANAVELAVAGQHARLYVADDEVAQAVHGKLRSRLGEKRELVEVLVAAPRPGTCSSCKAAILWAQTPNGKSMPLDVAPQKLVVLGRRTGQAHVIDAYTPHWATCPNSEQHRRPK